MKLPWLPQKGEEMPGRGEMGWRRGVLEPPLNSVSSQYRLQGGDDVFGLANVSAHIGPVIGEPTVPWSR